MNKLDKKMIKLKVISIYSMYYRDIKLKKIQLNFMSKGKIKKIKIKRQNYPKIMKSLKNKI